MFLSRKKSEIGFTGKKPDRLKSWLRGAFLAASVLVPINTSADFPEASYAMVTASGDFKPAEARLAQLLMYADGDHPVINVLNPDGVTYLLYTLPGDEKPTCFRFEWPDKDILKIKAVGQEPDCYTDEALNSAPDFSLTLGDVGLQLGI